MLSAINDFLLGTLLLVIGFGLYELFLSKPGKKQLFAMPKWIKLGSLADLNRLAVKLILLMLIVGFFAKSLAFKISSPISIIYLAGSILLIALTINIPFLKK